MRCYNCNDDGHLSKFCPAPPKFERCEFCLKTNTHAVGCQKAVVAENAPPFRLRWSEEKIPIIKIGKAGRPETTVVIESPRTLQFEEEKIKVTKKDRSELMIEGEFERIIQIKICHEVKGSLRWIISNHDCRVPPRYHLTKLMSTSRQRTSIICCP